MIVCKELMVGNVVGLFAVGVVAFSFLLKSQLLEKWNVKSA